MIKTIFIITLSCFIIKNANSQTTKGNWLAGGNASFSSLKSSSASATQFKQTSVQISPSIGYFLKDNFAIGLRPSLTYGNNSVANSNTILALGPFVRCYFLKTENIVNLFLDGSYSYGNLSGKGQGSVTSNTFSISGGTVVYFNSSVGLEFGFAYSTTKVVGYTGNNNETRFGIGFQIHLEK